MKITNVRLEMEDYTGKKIVREIDITNIMKTDNDGGLKLASGKEQELLLKNWIRERGNEQHNTELNLVDWEIV